MSRFVIPLVLFVLLVVFLAVGLRHDPHEIPSPLINKPAPAFQLSQLKDPAKTFAAEEMKGKVWLLNVWASWCPVCRDEHPFLLQYARSGAVPIYGLNSKDKPEDALGWLGELGDPYVLSVSDLDGRVGIDYGVYGAPETYVIDRDGIIRFKLIGPINSYECEPTESSKRDGCTPEIWRDQILPLVQKLNK
jgi:cytochrome c biogenesis protein CcmG/thiol:disulfide interchange protein DsbE